MVRAWIYPLMDYIWKDIKQMQNKGFAEAPSCVNEYVIVSASKRIYILVRNRIFLFSTIFPLEEESDTRLKYLLKKRKFIKTNWKKWWSKKEQSILRFSEIWLVTNKLAISMCSAA